MNAGVALWSTWLFQEQIGRMHSLRASCLVVAAVLGVGMVYAERISAAADNNLYADDVIFSREHAISADCTY